MGGSPDAGTTVHPLLHELGHHLVGVRARQGPCPTSSGATSSDEQRRAAPLPRRLSRLCALPARQAAAAPARHGPPGPNQCSLESSFGSLHPARHLCTNPLLRAVPGACQHIQPRRLDQYLCRWAAGVGWGWGRGAGQGGMPSGGCLSPPHGVQPASTGPASVSEALLECCGLCCKLFSVHTENTLQITGSQEQQARHGQASALHIHTQPDGPCPTCCHT